MLDGGEQPLAAAAADEGPHLLGLDRVARVAAGQPVRVARRAPDPDEVVERPPFEIGGGVLQVAFFPALGQVALEELDIGDDVAHPLARVAGQLLGEIAQHFRRHQRPQPPQLARAPRLLHHGVDRLKRLQVGIGQVDVAPAIGPDPPTSQRPLLFLQGIYKQGHLFLQPPDHLRSA